MQIQLEDGLAHCRSKSRTLSDEWDLFREENGDIQRLKRDEGNFSLNPRHLRVSVFAGKHDPHAILKTRNSRQVDYNTGSAPSLNPKNVAPAFIDRGTFNIIKILQ